MFREIAAQDPSPKIFEDGEGLRALKQRLIRKTERQRLKDARLESSSRTRGTVRRLLLVSNPSAFSGSEEVLCTAAENLDRNRFETFALIAGKGHFSDRMRRTAKSVLVPEADFSKPALRSLEIVCSALNDFSPDIVHCNGPTGFPMLAALKLSGTPWIQHVHTVDVQPLAEFCAAAEAIIAVSDFVARELLYLDIDPTRIRVIRNCVDFAGRFRRSLSRSEARRRLGLPAEGFMLVYPARFALLKRHNVLAAALAEVVERESDVHLVLAGEATAEPHLHDDFHAFVKHHGLAQHVTQFPFVRDMPALYTASDALVFPAEQEPLGLCILEAMAMEVPVIACRSGGIPEIVQHESTGLLVEPGRPQALTATILRIISERALRTRLTASALNYVQKEHSLSNYGRTLADLYEEVLSSRTSRPVRSPRQAASA